MGISLAIITSVGASEEWIPIELDNFVRSKCYSYSIIKHSLATYFRIFVWFKIMLYIIGVENKIYYSAYIYLIYTVMFMEKGTLIIFYYYKHIFLLNCKWPNQ